ncbi:hypothetical protein BH11ARM2_BH11ARM2_26550 [soil metagenome]
MAALALAGFAGYRVVFGRTAEGALALIPADAQAIVLVDMAPVDPSQAMVFHQIDSELDSTGLSKMFNDAFMSANGNHSPTASKLASLLRRSGAIALFDEKKGQGVALIGLTDPGEAQRILEKEGKPQFWKGLRYWTLPQGGKAAIRVEGDWMVLSDSGASLLKLRRVEQGQEASAADDAGIQAARKGIGGPANLEVLASPSLFPMPEKAPKTVGWIACGGVVRDGGLAITSRVRLDTATLGEYAALFRTTPLSAQPLEQLPSGAYGVMALAQPGEAIKSVQKDLNFDVGDRKDMAEAIGLDLDSDIIPALQGETTLAAYPDAQGGGIDGLFVISDAHGATPGAAVKKFREHVEGQIAQHHDESPFVSIQIEGTQEAWRLSPKIEEDMKPHSDGGPVDTDRLTKDKTMAWAIVGDRVIAATNESLLRRAIAAKDQPLSSEPLFASSFADGPQYAFAADPARVASGIRKTLRLDKMETQPRKMVDGMLKLFEGLKDPLALKASLRPDGTVVGEAVVPLDWVRTIRFIGDTANKH